MPRRPLTSTLLNVPFSKPATSAFGSAGIRQGMATSWKDILARLNWKHMLAEAARFSFRGQHLSDWRLLLARKNVGDTGYRLSDPVPGAASRICDRLKQGSDSGFLIVIGSAVTLQQKKLVFRV